MPPRTGMYGIAELISQYTVRFPIFRRPRAPRRPSHAQSRAAALRAMRGRAGALGGQHARWRAQPLGADNIYPSTGRIPLVRYSEAAIVRVLYSSELNLFDFCTPHDVSVADDT